MIKLLIGGSPCTYWSIAQSHNRETTCEGQGWELFKNYLFAKDLFKPDFFLYENNCSASKEIKEEIEKSLDYKRIEFNSSLVSAQNRSRFYVTNIANVTLPQDKGIIVRDILDDSSYNGKFYQISDKISNKRPSKTGIKRVGIVNHSNSQGNRVYSIDGKAPTLTANGGGMGAKTGLFLMDNGDVRKLSVKEARRLQTVPDYIKFNCSNTQIYKQLGNGWTIDVIKEFFKHLPKDEEIVVLSMYDGMSCGQIALKELGLNIKIYIAVEIDKYCQDTIMTNFPNTILFSDAFDIRDKNSELYSYIENIK